LIQFYNPIPKIRGTFPEKKLWPKACYIWHNFGQQQTSMANISAADQNIENPKDIIDDNPSRVREKRL